MLAISQACNPGTDAEAGSLGYVLSSRLAREGPVSLPTYEGGGECYKQVCFKVNLIWDFSTGESIAVAGEAACG